MKKSDLTKDHQDRIDFAVRQGLNTQDWEPINLLGGGLTNVPVYKIKIIDKYYAIKLENIYDKNFDLVRNYKIIEAVSKQGISPKAYFTDAQQGIVLMQYVEPKQRPEVSPLWIKKLANIVRSLHDNNSFKNWKSVAEIIDCNYQKLLPEYKLNNGIKKSMHEIKNLENILFDPKDIRSCHCDLNPANVLFDPKDIRSCHCDLNPANVLFDGNNYIFVDWQAASPQSFYFDLACVASWFYFCNEDFCDLFLEYYFGREATEEEKAKYYLMRIFVNIYFGIGFISLSLQTKSDSSVLKDTDIGKLPTYFSFLQSIGLGQVNLSDANTQQCFGFVFLKTAESMMNQKYQQAYKLLSDSVKLLAYNTEWPKMAEIEIKKLSQIMPRKHIIDIQHVGSTAIPGCIAKPIIDIQIAVDALVSFKPMAIDLLKTLDYEYWAENPDPDRLFFAKGMSPLGDKRTHHVHIVERDSKHWKEKILFRDYLIAHPNVAREYEKLKQNLAKQYLHDREKYTDGKSKFISEILKLAGRNL